MLGSQQDRWGCWSVLLPAGLTALHCTHCLLVPGPLYWKETRPWSDSFGLQLVRIFIWIFVCNFSLVVTSLLPVKAAAAAASVTCYATLHFLHLSGRDGTCSRGVNCCLVSLLRHERDLPWILHWTVFLGLFSTVFQITSGKCLSLSESFPVDLTHKESLIQSQSGDSLESYIPLLGIPTETWSKFTKASTTTFLSLKILMKCCYLIISWLLKLNPFFRCSGWIKKLINWKWSKVCPWLDSYVCRSFSWDGDWLCSLTRPNKTFEREQIFPHHLQVNIMSCINFLLLMTCVTDCVFMALENLELLP